MSLERHVTPASLCDIGAAAICSSDVNMHFYSWSPLDDNTKALPNRALADLNIKAQCFSNVFRMCRSACVALTLQLEPSVRIRTTPLQNSS